MKETWWHIHDDKKLNSPSLLVFPERIRSNTKKMIEIAGDLKILRPHIKTHKIAEIIKIQLEEGIDKFKCATIAEAELLGVCGAKDILLAMQPVGINLDRFFELIYSYPDSNFSTIVDNTDSLYAFETLAKHHNILVDLWVDINNGMNRTGISPGPEALELYISLEKSKNINARGLHVYDGHIHNKDFQEREKICNEDFYPVAKLKNDIEAMGFHVDKIVAGGTPTFPIHRKREDIEVSPGTTLLWDEGYAKKYPDLNFLHAALIFCRVISKPSENLFCLDLGHKVVASEMNLPRVKFINQSGLEQISQSEEHLVVASLKKKNFNIGDSFFAIPIHICPTVSKYPEVLPVVNAKIQKPWSVVARDHKILI